MEELLNELRLRGWLVAIHNNYRQSGYSGVLSFWLFTHEDGRYLKAEGSNDVSCLGSILMRARLQAATA